jgi:ATP-dependent DNA ligase
VTSDLASPPAGRQRPTGVLAGEGYVAKDPESPYKGGRTLSWLKVKQRDDRVEARGWDNLK